jgi:hypothetical protein
MFSFAKYYHLLFTFYYIEEYQNKLTSTLQLVFGLTADNGGGADTGNTKTRNMRTVTKPRASEGAE